MLGVSFSDSIYCGRSPNIITVSAILQSHNEYGAYRGYAGRDVSVERYAQ